MTEITYKSVPISFSGEDVLAERGYAVSNINSDAIDVSLNQKRISTNNITADDISVNADVSNAVIGENGISLDINGPDGTTVTKAQHRAVTVVVEDAETADMGITVRYKDSEDETLEPLVTEMSEELARVAAAESVIGSIDSVAALLSVNDVAERSRSFTVKLAALDKEGEEVPHVQIYPSEVTFKAAAGTKKEVDLNVRTIDDDDSTYERTCRAPETITIKGPEEQVRHLNNISTKEIDLRYIYLDTEVPLEYELPEGIMIADEDLNKVAWVTVKEKETQEETE
jgi:YbbR domain-containing protein